MVFSVPRVIVSAIVLVVGVMFVINGIRTLRRSKEGGKPFGIIETAVGVALLGALLFATVP